MDKCKWCSHAAASKRGKATVDAVCPGFKLESVHRGLTSSRRVLRLRLLLLVDASGSMNGESALFSHKKTSVREIIKIIEGKLFPDRPRVQLGFGIFNERIAFADEFTSDPERLPRLISDTTARLKTPGYGSTALLDALEQSLAQFGSIQPGDTVLVITDGGDNKSRVSQKQIEQQFADKGVRILLFSSMNRLQSRKK